MTIRKSDKRGVKRSKTGSVKLAYKILLQLYMEYKGFGPTVFWLSRLANRRSSFLSFVYFSNLAQANLLFKKETLHSKNQKQILKKKHCYFQLQWHISPNHSIMYLNFLSQNIFYLFMINHPFPYSFFLYITRDFYLIMV